MNKIFLLKLVLFCYIVNFLHHIISQSTVQYFLAINLSNLLMSSSLR